MSDKSRVFSASPIFVDGFKLTPVFPEEGTPQAEAWKRVFEEEDRHRKNPSSLTTSERYFAGAANFGLNDGTSCDDRPKSKTKK